jgi:hypothetical protein
MSARITHRQILLGAAVMAWWEFVTFIYVYAHDQGHDAPVTVYFFMGQSGHRDRRGHPSLLNTRRN